MEYYFSKKFSNFDLGTVNYVKCAVCGLVVSESHIKMDQRKWIKLNFNYHSVFQGTEINSDDPKWLKRIQCQANVIDNLCRNGFITKGNWIDYACGDGKMSDILRKYGYKIENYDKYTDAKKKNYLYDKDLVGKKYGLVINTSYFEHIRARNDLDNIVNLISDIGVLAVHTRVCERVPKDPDWPYLLPVHTSFFTNKSMQILFDFWEFKWSIYHPESRLWFWFKDKEKMKLAKKLNSDYYIKEGFVDYWK